MALAWGVVGALPRSAEHSELSTAVKGMTAASGYALAWAAGDSGIGEAQKTLWPGQEDPSIEFVSANCAEGRLDTSFSRAKRDVLIFQSAFDGRYY